MGSTLEVLKQIADKFLDKQNSPEGKTNEHGLFSDILNSNPSKENVNEAHEIQKNSEQERTSFFKEAERSFWLRQFPRLSKLTDMSKALGILKNDKEVVPWQHEFEYITAFTFLIPDRLLKIFTDPIAHSPTFQALVNHWPLINGVDLPFIGPNGKLLDKIKAGDPDAVIDAIRIMHQDIFVTGKIAMTQMYDIIKKYAGNYAAKAIVGGGGLAGLGILGSKLIKPSINNSAPQESLIQKGEDFIKHDLGLEVNLGDHSFKDILKLNPELKLTTAQTNLINLLDKLKVKDKAKLSEDSDWKGNNDEFNVTFVLNGNTYFLHFDNDPLSTDLTLKNKDGTQIYKSTDWAEFNAEEDAKEILKKIPLNQNNQQAA